MDARERFVAAVTAPEHEVPLDIAALCIAAHAHRDVDVDAWAGRIDTLAARCPDPTFDGVRAHLFDHEGFHGDLDNYADPENSFLDSVIERRRGIPITLSVMMIAVGRRLGVDVQGVGMPGHFLVFDGARGDAWCDPFHGGALLDADGCRRRFDLVYGGSLAFQPSFLEPTPPPAIVARLLANLERGELATDPVQRAWMCELHLAIPGLSFPEQWELADQLARTGDIMRAAAEYELIAERVEAGRDGDGPGETDADEAASQLRARARALRARLN
jgi:regulator of sirC expression with transglutaminase-like and TPR domain